MNPAPSARTPWPARDDDDLRVTPGALAAVRNHLLQAWAQSDALRRTFGGAAPFLAVTPLGLPARARLDAALSSRAIEVRRRFTLPDWPATATLLYVRQTGDADIARGAAYECAWRASFAPQGEIWELGGDGDYERLLEAKYEIRARFRSPRLTVAVADGNVKVKLHAFHVPDRLRLPIEGWWVRR